MQKNFLSIVFALGIVAGVFAPVMAETNLVPPIGITKAAADAAHVNVTGDTMTGVLLLPDGTGTDPSMGFASETGTGWHLSKALRMAASIDGIGAVFSIDGVGVTIDGDLIIGDAISDTVFFNAGILEFDSDTIINAVLDIIINTPGGIFRTTGPTEIESTLEAQGNTELGDAVGDTLTIRAGTETRPNATTVNIDSTYVFDATGQTPEMKAASWTFTGGIGVGAAPDASALIDMTSTTQGLGPPSMTTTQRDAISAPREGLLITNTTTNTTDFFDGTSWLSFSTNGATKEVSVAVAGNTDIKGNRAVKNLTTNGSANFTISIPADFVSLVALEVMAIPGTTGSGKDVDLSSDYSAAGEAFDANTESDTTITYIFTTDQLDAFDVSSVADGPGIAAGDTFGLLWNQNAAGVNNLVCLRLKYN